MLATRRVAEALKRQDWATVLIEFFLVVGGVLIALRLDQFAEDRRVDIQEVNFLQVVQADIARDIEDLTNIEQMFSAVREFGDDALSTIDDEPCSNDCWTKLVAFFQASQWMDVRLNSATYDEIKRTGFPRNQALKEQLSQYYSLGEQRYLIAGLPEYRELVRSIIPVNVQDHLWSECWQTSGRRQQLATECNASIDNQGAREIVAVLRSDPDIPRTLRYWLSTVTVINQTIPPQIREAEELIDALSHYIDNTL
jgi:hypothetical protein